MSDGGGAGTGVTLADGRVTLRPWSRTESSFMVDAFTDPAIQRYNGSHDRQGYPTGPLSAAEAETTVEEFTRRWQEFGSTGIPSGVGFLITDASSGEPVGCCGVDYWNDEDVAQIGYWLAAPGRGKGYATRAVILLTRWLFELGAARVSLTVVAGNDGSVAVARRAGFVHEGTMRALSVWQGQRYDVLWFAALPQEWMTRASEDDRVN